MNDTKICPYCGKEIKAVAQKCRFCGKWLNEEIHIGKPNNPNDINQREISEKLNTKQIPEPKSKTYNKLTQEDAIEKQVQRFNIFMLLFMFLPAIIFIIIKPYLHEIPFIHDNQNIEIKSDIKNKNLSTILNQIDIYQARYWAIVKRNDVFFTQNNNIIENDGGDLSDLFNEVIEKININNSYLKQLLKEETQYNKKASKFFKFGNIFKFSRSTRITLNQFNPKKDISKLVVCDNQFHETLDNLLNELYQQIGTTVNSNDFEQLKQSQAKWLNDVNSYRNTYSINMNNEASDKHNEMFFINTTWEFRILLLMMYLS